MQVYSAGKNIGGPDLNFQQGDIVHMLLNCDAHTFTVKNKTKGLSHELNLPSKGKNVYYPHFNLHGPSESITAMPIAQNEF